MSINRLTASKLHGSPRKELGYGHTLSWWLLLRDLCGKRRFAPKSVVLLKPRCQGVKFAVPLESIQLSFCSDYETEISRASKMATALIPSFGGLFQGSICHGDIVLWCIADRR